VIPNDQPVHGVEDSTGVKVYGEGEWKTRQPGVSQRRTWRKLHLGVDEKTGEILAAVVTTNNDHDSEVLPDLLDAIPNPIEQVSGDGAYDPFDSYDAIKQRQAKAAIPPRKDGKIHQHGNGKAPPHPRDENLRRIRTVGRKRWQQESHYHRRSIAETTMFRLKVIFGGKLRSRKFDNQTVELFLQCAALQTLDHCLGRCLLGPLKFCSENS
jgi:IS5 family transposase